LNPVFLALGTTTLTEYTDSLNVKNGFSYCYYIESEGAYSDPTIFKPIKNKSQIECARAKDTTAPCVPTMSLDADCEKGFVRIIWSDVTKICGRSDDVNRYILFYKPGVNDPYTQVADGPLQSYVYDGLELISGCYAVQAVDVHGNKSKLSEDFCIDNCPEFELPNIFTPNSDGVNDFYKAIKVRQIKEIGLVIVDRWGNTVYRTSDPYFQWNGQSILTKAPVSDGTYFYICDVYEPRLQGVIKRTIRGYLNVTR
jgi:gliding motility-associated-like protein